jgi:hypothetical protein
MEQSLSAPLMTGSSGEPTSSEQPYSYRAKALYNCECLRIGLGWFACQLHRRLLTLVVIDTASADDPNELSFQKGELMDIVDNSGKWWQAKKADGTTGSEYHSCNLTLPLGLLREGTFEGCLAAQIWNMC